MTSMLHLEEKLIEEALSWHLKLREADEAIWQEFTAWLESDPANNAAYEAVAQYDADLDSLVTDDAFPVEDDVLVAANDTEPGVYDPVVSSPAVWRWGAMAAALAFVVVLTTQFLGTRPDTYVVATAPGETQTVNLAEGSEIRINGSSRLVLDRNNHRYAELVAGEAHFTVVHDADNPFIVTVGDSRLVDLGTVFNVIKASDSLRVGVAEGIVQYEGEKQVRLTPGDALRRTNDGQIVLTQHPVSAIGGWVDGVLVYNNAVMGDIVADVSRATGLTIEVAPQLRHRLFSGVIQTDGNLIELEERFETLMNIEVEKEGQNWVIQP